MSAFDRWGTAVVGSFAPIAVVTIRFVGTRMRTFFQLGGKRMRSLPPKLGTASPATAGRIDGSLGPFQTI